MLLRRISAFLSLLAVIFLALACSLGYRADPEARPDQYTRSEASPHPSPVLAAGDVCDQLDHRVNRCGDDLMRRRYPEDYARFSGPILKLVQIKRRIYLGEDASRLCQRAKRRGDAKRVERCLGQPACGAFASCLAENF